MTDNSTKILAAKLQAIANFSFYTASINNYKPFKRFKDKSNNKFVICKN